MKNLIYIGNKLAKHGLNRTGIENLGPLLEKEGFKLTYASSKKSKILRMLEMVWVTIANCRKTDYVLIDTYSTSNFWYALLVSQLCRALKLAYIPQLHGGNLPDRLLKNPYLCKLIFVNSYANVAPSGYLLHAFQMAGFSKTVYIPNTIELKNYTFKQVDAVAPKLLWVRSLAAIYNPEMAIRTAYELKKDYPDTELCMVGPDKANMKDKLTQLAKALEVAVTFTGRLSREKWTKLSEDYHIFINTTHLDNMPVSVIEAMALGLPVVSTNVGGIPYLVEDRKTGLLVDDNDALQMAVCVQEILQDRQLKDDLVVNAHHLVQEFDSEIVISKWIEILV